MASNAYYASQGRMDEAIEAISKEVFKKIADCARFYGVNRNTLLRRLHEKSSRSARIALNKRLTDAEEHSLMAYIRYYDEKNLSITSKLLAEAANFLIHARDSSAKPVEDSWSKRFLKRHPEVKNRRTRSISAERKDVYEFKELEVYFRGFEIIISLFKQRRRRLHHIVSFRYINRLRSTLQASKISIY